MRYFAIGLILLFMALPCMAEQENLTTGPYNISFDLGLLKSAYSLEIVDPIETETLGGDLVKKYEIEISNRTRIGNLIIISLDEGNIPIKPTGEELARIMKHSLPDAGRWDIQATSRIIDGKDGAIASYKTLLSKKECLVYMASYYPDENTTVRVTSGYPWDDGTLALLRSIHIERNSTGSA
jgi:hypothetical protein